MKQITKFKEFFANAEDFMPICIPKVIDISYKAKLLEAIELPNLSVDNYSVIELYNNLVGNIITIFQLEDYIYIWSSKESIATIDWLSNAHHSFEAITFSHPTMNFILVSELNGEKLQFRFQGVEEAASIQLFSLKTPALSLKAVQLLSEELWDYNLLDSDITKFITQRSKIDPVFH